MKRFLGFFLFQTRPEDGWSAGRRAGYWVWNTLALVLGAAALGVCSLVLATSSYGWELFRDYWKFPSLIALNLLPPVLLALLLYAASGRIWAALLLTALPVMGLSLGNYYKLLFRDDPVIAADLFILQEAGKMAGQYQLTVGRKVALAVLLAAAWTGLAALFARARPDRRLRLGLAAGALAAALALTPVYGSTGIYDGIENFEHASRWSSTQVYISKGLIYPFLHSVRDALPNPPEGYSEKETAALLARYEDGEIPEDKKVNIVGIMLEAFADLSVYGQIEFQQDVYAVYHALEAEGCSGTLVTDIFAGGTINTERAFLTGIPGTGHDYRANTSSYVWYLKEQGYRTSGDHPSNQWFYNRQNVNSYLGFDSYRYIENFYTWYTGGSTAYDYIMFPLLTDLIMVQVEEDAPLFSFSVSYQGHGPYADDGCWWGETDDYIANYELDQGERNILANYLGSVMDTQAHLANMVDTFRASGEPIVLVVFGDHKPWLGNGNSVYEALGIELAQDSKENFYSYWSTRYLIWANDAATEVIGHDITGTGPDVSPCFLMNVLFDQLGWKGDAYMQAVDECRRELPVVHAQGRYITADGELKTASELTQGQTALIRRFRYLKYYRQNHFSP